MRFEDKNALIIGGSKGIAAAFATALHVEGANVLCVSRNKKNLESIKKSVAKKKRGVFDVFQGDVSNPELSKEIQKYVTKTLGDIDILILNSGGPQPGLYSSLSNSDWEFASQNLLLGQIRIFKEFAPKMAEKGFGRILYLGSTVMQEPSESMILSSTLRAAMATYCKAASISLAKNGVTVNTISTGGVKTDRLMGLLKNAAESDGSTIQEKLTQTAETIPMRRIAEPKEFIQLMLFLASESSSYITGQTIGVDGGLLKATF